MLQQMRMLLLNNLLKIKHAKKDMYYERFEYAHMYCLQKRNR